MILLSLVFKTLALLFGFIAGLCLAFILGVVAVAYLIKPPDHRSSRRDHHG